MNTSKNINGVGGNQHPSYSTIFIRLEVALLLALSTASSSTYASEGSHVIEIPSVKPPLIDFQTPKIKPTDSREKKDKKIEKDTDLRRRNLRRRKTGVPEIRFIDALRNIKKARTHYQLTPKYIIYKRLVTVDRYGFPLPPGQVRYVVVKKLKTDKALRNISIIERRSRLASEVLKSSRGGNIPGIDARRIEAGGLENDEKEIDVGNNSVTYFIESLRTLQNSIVPLESSVDGRPELTDERENRIGGDPPHLPEIAEIPLDSGDLSELGMISLYLPEAKQKKLILYSASVGAGKQDDRALNLSLGVRLMDNIFSGVYNRSQWLDEKTNTGKFVSTLSLDYCPSISFGSKRFAVQPCYSGGTGEGEWKERNALNQIVVNRTQRSIYKVYLRFVTLFPIPKKGSLAIEGVMGYSEDVFLYGPYFQSWIKTPFFDLSLGLETYTGQRNLLSIGFAGSSF